MGETDFLAGSYNCIAYLYTQGAAGAGRFIQNVLGYVRAHIGLAVAVVPEEV